MKVQTLSGVVIETPLTDIIAHERELIGKHVIESFKSNESINKIQDYILKADNDLELFIKTITDNQDLTLIQDCETESYVIEQ